MSVTRPELKPSNAGSASPEAERGVEVDQQVEAGGPEENSIAE
jgi:hypothetical protein